MALDVPDGWGLDGKVAVVTGGGAAGEGIGNGRAAAILLAKAGARVVVVDREGALAKRTVEMIGEGGWRRVMQVNVDSMFLAAKHAIPAMRRAGGGAIVDVSSISALRPRGLTAYSVSKGAVIALTRAMAVDHGAGARLPVGPC